MGAYDFIIESTENLPKAARVVAKLRGIRAWESDHLPVKDSVVPYDILLVLLDAELCGSALLGFKALCLVDKKSERATRINLRRLEGAGWVVIHNVSDSRCKSFALALARMETLRRNLQKFT